MSGKVKCSVNILYLNNCVFIEVELLSSLVRERQPLPSAGDWLSSVESGKERRYVASQT